MLVVGIDPGSVNTGFAWIRGGDHQVRNHSYKSVFSTFWKATQRMPYRWIRMRDRLEGQLKQLPEPPDMVVIEEPAREQCRRPDDRRSISIFFGAYAVTVAEVSRLFRDTVVIPVRYMSWNGGLSKPDVIGRLSRKYKKTTLTCEDEVDAIGLADFGWEIVSDKRRKALCSSTTSSALSGPPSENKIQNVAPSSGS